MDRREAIEWLKSIRRTSVFEQVEALDLAIEALKGDLHCPKCGTIVRNGRQYHDLVYRGESQTTESQGERMTRIVHELSGCDAESATTTDCISRQKAIEAVELMMGNLGTPYVSEKELNERATEYIKELPSVTPTERTGEWIEVDSWEAERHSVTDMRCSVCGKYSSQVLPHKTRCTYNFCPNCGAKMGGDTE